MSIKIHSHTAQSGKVFRKLLMAEVFEALGMPEQAEAGCVLSKDRKSLILWDVKAKETGNIPAKDREGPEFLGAVKLWAEHIMSGAGKLQDIPHDNLRAAVSRAIAKPARGLPLPPIKESLPMPPKRMVTEEGPVGTTITRRKKTGTNN
jgi:hypothetical protein